MRPTGAVTLTWASTRGDELALEVALKHGEGWALAYHMTTELRVSHNEWRQLGTSTDVPVRSRVWLLGLLLILILALVLSSVAMWLKICSLGLAVLLGLAMVAASEPIFRFLAQESRSNRVAALITAIDEGDRKAAGLGTFLFRRQLNARTLDALGSSSTVQLLFGHGTSNGRLLLGDTKRGIGDPNRAVHNEWLRILYEWGTVGFLMWLAFLASIAAFAWRGVQMDPRGYAKPLLVYLPAFLLALLGENILAGAGHAENIGFILLIAIAVISHRRSAPRTFTYTEDVSLHASVASS